jgi:hypothetical protein
MKGWMKSGLMAMLITPPAYAYVGFGICNYGKQVVSSVVCYQPAVLKETTINGDIKVTGSLKADLITVHDVQIEGNVEIGNSQVNGDVNVVGSFFADHVAFNKSLAVTGTNIVLNHSKVNGLVIITSDNGTPYLQVQCETVIKGSILFDKKAGVVQITGDSFIQGKVSNGSLEFVKHTC